MNKYILIIIFFVAVINTSAQVARYKVTIQQTTSSSNTYSGQCANEISFYFKYSDNSSYSEVVKISDVRPNQTYHDTIYFPATRTLSYFYTWGKRSWRNGGGCNDGGNNISQFYYVTLPCTDLEGNFVNNWGLNTIFKIKPDTVVINQNQNYYLSSSDRIDLTATTGFPTVVYKWEYSSDGITWNTFPSTLNGSSSVNISGNDLFGSVFDVMSGTVNSTFVRINYGCGYSNVITLTNQISSPKITSVTPIPNKCFGENTGSVKIYFDRQLYANESLIIYDSLNVPGYETKSAIITSLNSADFSYTLPAELPAGTHTIRLQGVYPNTPPLKPTYSEGANHHKVYTINGPSKLVLNATPTFTPVNCNSGSDGTITINASGGTGTKSAGYWINGATDTTWQTFNTATNHSITALLAGDYRLCIKDANGCVLKDNSGNEITPAAIIAQPAEALRVDNKNFANPLAFGSADGNTEVIIAGGTPLTSGAYNVQWLKNGTPQTPVNTVSPFKTTLNNISDGQYILTATDQNYTTATGINNQKGCIVKDTITLIQPPLLTVSIQQTQNIICNGQSTGKLEANTTGGILRPSVRYLFKWQKDVSGTWADIGQTDSIAENLVAANYKVIVTDYNGITKEATFNLQQPSLFTYDTAYANVLCNAGSDGTLTVNATGGVGNYQLGFNIAGENIAWSPFNNITQHNITGLPANTYVIHVKDGNSCIMKDASDNEIVRYVEVQQPAQPLQISSSQIHPPLSFGSTDGSIMLALAGGTPLTTGTYNMAWRDSLSNTITPVNTISPVTTSVQNLGQGSYFITVTDANYSLATGANANGCFVTDTFRLLQPPLLQLSIIKQDSILCNGYNTGKLYAQATGGIEIPVQRYQYKWQKEVSGAWADIGQSDSIATNLTAGNYKAIITDHNGIIKEAILQLTQPTAVSYSATSADVWCNNGADGMITINADGGVGNYQAGMQVNGGAVRWASFSTALQFTVDTLRAANYTLYVKDSNNCVMRDGSNAEVITPITITQPAQHLQITTAVRVNPLAYGYTDGSIAVSLAGGTPQSSGAYNVNWKNAAGTTLTTFANTLSPFTTTLQSAGDGWYTITANDDHYIHATGNNANGCIVTDSFHLIQPPPLTVNIAETHFVSCYNYSDGQLQAHAQGGIQIPAVRYQYKWQKNDNGSWIDIGQSDSTAINLSRGQYKIIVTDFNGIKAENIYTLVQPDTLKVSLAGSTVTACHSSDGTISATIAGGTVPYSIEWSNGANTTELANLPKGKYLAFVTDPRGCMAQKQVQLYAPNPIVITDSLVTNATCFGDNDGAINYTLRGGVAPYNFLWSNGNTQQNLGNLPAGDYSVTVTDAETCSEIFDFHITQPPQVTISLGGDKTLCTDQAWLADATIPNGISYNWTSDNGFTANTPKATLTNAGTYNITATNDKGCKGSAGMRIQRSSAIIAATFTGSTQSFTGDDVVFVNISNPPAETIEWMLPSSTNVQVLEKNEHLARIRFADTGYYSITMKAGIGNCEKQMSQNITIVKKSNLDSPGDAPDPFIKKFTVAPNPSSGQFKVLLSLREAAQINLTLVSMNNGKIMNQRKESGQADYEIPYNINLLAGTYVLLLETPKGNMTFKILIL